ncbi:MAG: heme exporter protein CcmD [Pseudomonadota bacterium]
MFDFGKHAFFIWGSYGTVIVVIAALVWWLVSDGNRYATALKRLEGDRNGPDKKQG